MNQLTDDQKINSIIRHIKKVEDNCNQLAKAYIDKDKNFAIGLIILGRKHDLSKFGPYEFNHLWEGDDKFEDAIGMHRAGNKHHPEHVIWGGDINNMSDMFIAEMVCDCLARSQEFGTDIKEWFFGKEPQNAPAKYKYSEKDYVWNKISEYLDVLLTPTFRQNLNNER